MPRISQYGKAMTFSAFVWLIVALVWTVTHERGVQQWAFWQRERVTPVTEEWSLVARVVDGDTIELESGERVRYIGINTPETVKPNAPVECFGHEASAYNRQLVAGKRVRLAKDVSERDRYGRLLRFVYLEDGTFVNDVLVRDGYAYASTFPPDVAEASVFRAAEVEARTAKRGLWASDMCDGKK